MVLRVLLLSALLTLVPVAVGVTVAGDRTPDDPGPVAYRGTDLADFDSSTAVVQRGAFCDLIPDEAVDEALDGGEGDLTAYDNGTDSDAVPGGDVAHEYGCRFAADGVEARAWVFAPPVSTKRAKALVKASNAKGCRAQPEAPAYGKPSVALICSAGDRREVSYRGLFGDAWLTCTIATPAGVEESDQVDRAGRWCVAAAQAAAAG